MKPNGFVSPDVIDTLVRYQELLTAGARSVDTQALVGLTGNEGGGAILVASNTLESQASIGHMLANDRAYEPLRGVAIVVDFEPTRKNGATGAIVLPPKKTTSASL